MPLNIIISSTQVDSTWGCPRKFQFEDILGIQLKKEFHDDKRKERDYKKDRGTLFHKLLEKYYKAKQQNIRLDSDFIVAVMNFGRGYGSTDLGLPEEHVEKTVRKFRDYHTYYQANDYNIIEGVEESYHRPLFEDKEVKIALEGTIDLRVINNGGQKLVTDHKSGSWETGFLSNQFMTYKFLAGDEYRMVVENHCPIDSPETFKRHIYSYSQRLIEEWRTSTINRILLFAKYEKEGSYPPDFTRCKEFGGCQFFELCSQDPENRASMIVAEFEHVENDHFKERFEKKV